MAILVIRTIQERPLKRKSIPILITTTNTSQQETSALSRETANGYF